MSVPENEGRGDTFRSGNRVGLRETNVLLLELDKSCLLVSQEDLRSVNESKGLANVLECESESICRMQISPTAVEKPLFTRVITKNIYTRV